MTNEEILQQQVEALEKLLMLKNAIIAELESKITKLEYQTNPVNIPFIQTPNIQPMQFTPDCCPDGQPHVYPQVWGGTVPPCCQRCGKPMPHYPIVSTSSTLTVAPDNDDMLVTTIADMATGKNV